MINSVANFFEKHKGKIFSLFGFTFLLLAFCVAWNVVQNYLDWSKGTISFGPPARDDQPPSIQDLATVLAGTSGLLLTVSGIIYLVFTIHQSKVEMIATNKVMSKQLAESTFFNLLKNHKDIYFGHAKDSVDFQNEIERLKIKLRGYVKSVNEREWAFEGFESTGFQPKYLYGDNDNFIAIGKNILHIINYIDENLENKEFYHSTFYLSLSLEERFLIGMIINYALEKTDKIAFYYQEYFEDNSFPVDIESEIPKLLLSRNLHQLKFPVKNLAQTANTLKRIAEGTVFLVDNYDEVKLERIWYSVNSWKYLDHVKYANNQLQFNGSEVNLATIFNEFILSELQLEHEVALDLHFIYNYKGQKVNVYERNINFKAVFLDSGYQIESNRTVRTVVP